MTITWRSAKDDPPADKQEVFITCERGLISQPIVGPITYLADRRAFLDLLATAKTGVMFPADDEEEEGAMPLWWVDHTAIPLP